MEINQKIRSILNSKGRDVWSIGPDHKPDTQDDITIIRCQRMHKMELLRRINTLGESVHDIVVREPSLEDVFLGYAG